MCGQNAKKIPRRPGTAVILQAQKYCRARVEGRWIMLFKATKDLGSKKKKPSVSDTVEDILLKRKLQRSENAWKVCLHINRSY